MKFKTPIGLWGWREIAPEETAAGLLLRIAEIQGHASTDRTAEAAGISRSRLAHGFVDHLEAFAARVDQSFASIAADGALRDGKGRLCLRGHPMGDLLDFGPRRMCPACLEEAWHHRFWWDVRPITTCPRHGIELIGACRCGAKFGWRRGGLLKCSSCWNDEVAYLPRKPADPKALRADAYLLSRFGAGRADAVPVLDALSLRHVFETLERIGAASYGGYSYEWQSAESLKQPLPAVQARGFEVLADGRLDEVLTTIYDGFIAKGGKPEEGFSSCYGWLYHWFNHKRGARFSPLLAQSFLEHGAARFPIVPKARLGRLRPAAERKLSLKAAAKRAETSVYTMKSIGLALRLIRTEKRSGSQISFPVEEVERIARDLKGAMNLDEVQRRLGIGQKPMAALLADGTLVPALRGGGHRHDYVFRAQDVREFLAKLGHGSGKVTVVPKDFIAIADLGRGKVTTIAECVRKILDGRLSVRIRMEGPPGLQALFVQHDELLQAAAGPAAGPDLPFAAAARRMRLNSRGLRRAIDGGFLKGVTPGSKTVPAKVAERFAERFIMLGEIRERIGGTFPTLRDQFDRVGFAPDPDLEKCLCAGYLRQTIEPSLRRLEAGEVSLQAPEGSWRTVVEETRRLLAAAKSPLPSDDLVTKVRRKTKLGPSDRMDYFYAVMHQEKGAFVHITGAGWWLRVRSYLGCTFPLGGGEMSQADIVDGAVVGHLRAATRPIAQDDVIAWLKERSIHIPMGDETVFVRRLVARNTEKIIKLTGLGYWDRSRPYPPALYDPATWSGKVQTADQRTGLWIIELLRQFGRPLCRAELEPLLQQRDIIPTKCSRAYVGNAVAEFADEIVYLARVGYWLKRKPWPAAGYRGAAGKKAA